MPGILITGADGFIAQNLVQFLNRQGYVLYGQSLQENPLPGFAKTFKANLTEPLPDDIINEQLEGIIHGANHVGKNEYEINVRGTTLWAEQINPHVKWQLFLSSISARADAESPYGRAKYELEKWFFQHHHCVLRLGLVIGNGGLYARMAAMVQKLPFVPLLDGGRQSIFFIGIKPLLHIIGKIVQDQGKSYSRQPWNLFQKEPITLREMLQIIAKHQGKRRLFIPIPIKWITPIIALNEKIGLLKLPINTNNLTGLNANSQNPYNTDYHQFNQPEYPFAAMISEL